MQRLDDNWPDFFSINCNECPLQDKWLTDRANLLWVDNNKVQLLNYDANPIYSFNLWIKTTAVYDHQLYI